MLRGKHSHRRWCAKHSKFSSKITRENPLFSLLTCFGVHVAGGNVKCKQKQAATVKIGNRMIHPESIRFEGYTSTKVVWNIGDDVVGPTLKFDGRKRKMKESRVDGSWWWWWWNGICFDFSSGFLINIREKLGKFRRNNSLNWTKRKSKATRLNSVIRVPFIAGAINILHKNFLLLIADVISVFYGFVAINAPGSALKCERIYLNGI